MYTISEQARFAIELLHNSRDLCAGRQLRPLAADVARACMLRVESCGTIGDTDALEALLRALPGKMQGDLDLLYKAAEETILAADLARDRRSVDKDDVIDWETYKKSLNS